HSPDSVFLPTQSSPKFEGSRSHKGSRLPSQRFQIVLKVEHLPSALLNPLLSGHNPSFTPHLDARWKAPHLRLAPGR
ncbi:MAG: hypothetical protein ACK5QT_00505, partial [Oligoflexia bacterium]